MTVPQTTLHSNGPKISSLVYGIWRMHEDPLGSSPKRILEKIHTCLEQGIDTFDHADIYGDFGNEELFGAALKEEPSLYSRLKIITKCGIQIPGKKFKTKHYNTSAAHIRYSVERSLRKLGLDSLDLVLIHRPDPLMDPEEIAESFLSLSKEGKVKHFGVSNFTTSQFSLLQSAYSKPLVTNQIELSPLVSNALFDGTIDQLFESKCKAMVWSPTAGGRIFKPNEERAKALFETLSEIAKRYAVSPDQILYAWFRVHPAGLIPVLGTNDIDRIISASKSFSFEISRIEWFEILQAGRGKEVA
ncbi:oxidoreductase, aldo/keto reductase family protein [Leptospira ryugenii]|uniref:Oxidoreductase, aldo/keto reductase family protein n=1 Tax=Leptospira ryugenii TaxID=1917863 RepID=A0A2P2E1V6_9LEPT|nr:aldo/keto reductase [Leptospira ryugenii]GBF50849.1 oxidoreductase, aldo/keto reductase family protein [Leptospira ryugenii]